MQNTRITHVTMTALHGRTFNQCSNDAIKYCLENKCDVTLECSGNTYDVNYEVIKAVKDRLDELFKNEK